MGGNYLSHFEEKRFNDINKIGNPLKVLGVPKKVAAENQAPLQTISIPRRFDFQELGQDVSPLKNAVTVMKIH